MITNMAMSDLLFPIFLFPLNMVEMQADTWHISDPHYQTLCKIGFFLSTISAAVSIQSLILITVDRFGAVVVPIRSHSSVKGIVHSSSSPHGSSQKPHTRHICFLSNLLNTVEGWHGARDKYYLRTFTILYSIILIKLIKQHVHPGEHSANAEEQRSRGNWNLLKMAFVIVFVFFLCWIPSVSNWTILHFAPFCIWFSCNFLLYDTFT